MSSSAKIKSSSRLKKVRLLSLFNPLFLATMGIFSLFAFAIWQYWLNPDLSSTSVKISETPEENQQNVTEKNKGNISVTNQEENNKINALESITSNTNTNTNSKALPTPTPEQQFGSLLSQSNPSNEIFKSLTTQNNRNQNTTSGVKLYEQLRNLPSLFPDLLPPQTANNNILNSAVDGNVNVPANQLTQYQLRSNIQGNSNITTPLSQAVNNVMSNRNAANTNTQAPQGQYNGINTNVPPNNSTKYPNGNYGNTNGYSNYGNTNGYSNYGNYGNNYGNNNPYGNSYGGNVNGSNGNYYNSGQVPPQGYNNPRITQTGFPNSRF